MQNTMLKDLSEVENSTTTILSNNIPRINNCKTKSELLATVRTIFDENNLDTKATKRLLNNIARSKNYGSALAVIYDSILYGSQLGVIKTK